MIQPVLGAGLNLAVFATLLRAVGPSVLRFPYGCATEDLPRSAFGTGIGPPLGPGTGLGGLFSGQCMWAAVVNREGEICVYATSTSDPTQVWPGSQQIATARLTQPTPSVWFNSSALHF